MEYGFKIGEQFGMRASKSLFPILCRPVMVINPALKANKHESLCLSQTPNKDEKNENLWCPDVDCSMHMRQSLHVFFVNQLVASVLFLVGNSPRITISVLGTKLRVDLARNTNYFFPGADPPSQFEVGLFPLSIFYLVEEGEWHKELL